MVGKVKLGELLKTLRENGVSKYRRTEDAIEVEFGPNAHLKQPMLDNTAIDFMPGAGSKEAPTTPEETDDDELLFYSARP